MPISNEPLKSAIWLASLPDTKEVGYELCVDVVLSFPGFYLLWE